MCHIYALLVMLHSYNSAMNGEGFVPLLIETVS